MKQTRPVVAMATFCESVIQEKDDVISAMRIVDTAVTIARATADLTDEEKANAVTNLKLVLLVTLRAGDYQGKGDLAVTCKPPKDAPPLKRPAVFQNTVEFKSGHGGVTFIINVNFPVGSSGLYWFDVVYEGEVLTRVPLNMTLLQQSSATQPSSEHPPAHESRTH